MEMDPRPIVVYEEDSQESTAYWSARDKMLHKDEKHDPTG